MPCPPCMSRRLFNSFVLLVCAELTASEFRLYVVMPL
jgi:hypothetical protein